MPTDCEIVVDAVRFIKKCAKVSFESHIIVIYAGFFILFLLLACSMRLSALCVPDDYAGFVLCWVCDSSMGPDDILSRHCVGG